MTSDATVTKFEYFEETYRDGILTSSARVSFIGTVQELQEALTTL